MSTPFAYIGKGLTLDQFAAYVASYDFGSIPPDYIILHHTAVPSATWARYIGNGAVWDANEAGLSEQQIYAKRKRQLDGVRNYYRDTNKWSAGPHLWIDERWVWLFTPMDTIGVHAKEGNSYHDRAGKLHYSIGIEVVGYYEYVVWPLAVAHNVATAIALLRRRLGTFAYIAGPWAGKVSRHADYNKPECPGAQITPAYYLPLFQQAWAAVNAPPVRRFVAAYATPIYESSEHPSTVALGGRAMLVPGDVFEVDQEMSGWIHLANGVGFIPAGAAKEEL